MTAPRLLEYFQPEKQFLSQNVARPGTAVKASLLCAIFLGLAIFPSTGAASPNNGIAVIGPSINSMAYACTSVGIQQAINDAVNHANGITQSVVDASNCTSMTGTAFNSQIYVGVADSNQLTKERIKLILPANGAVVNGVWHGWEANINNSNGYALEWGNGAMIYGGTGSGEGQPFTISSASGSNLKAVCGNDPTYGTYFHVEGFSCVAGAGSTLQDGIIVIANNADESYLGHMTASSGGGTVPRGLWVFGACCSATFEDINVDTLFSNATSCAFGSPYSPYQGNNGIHVSKLSCLHPSAGQAAVLIIQTGSDTSPIGSSFRDVFMEQNSSNTDTTTPWVALRQIGNAYPAADLLDGFRTGVDITGSTRCVVEIGAGSRVNISNLGVSDTSTCAINDGVNGVTVTGATNSIIASYDMTSRYRLSLGAMTVNSLPPAAANVGTMFRVSDSTAITTTTEGQTCTGGSNNNALAFSNGSVWKCF